MLDLDDFSLILLPLFTFDNILCGEKRERMCSQKHVYFCAILNIKLNLKTSITLLGNACR